MNILNVSDLIQFLQTATPTAKVDITNTLIIDDDDDLYGIALLGSLVAQHPNGGAVTSDFWVDLVLDPSGAKQPYIMISDTCVFKSDGITVLNHNGTEIHKPIDEIHELIDAHAVWDKFIPHQNLKELETTFFNEVERLYKGDLSIHNVKSRENIIVEPV